MDDKYSQEEIVNKINSAPLFPMVIKVNGKWTRDFELSKEEQDQIYETLK